jgi:hypothetical protein
LSIAEPSSGRDSLTTDALNSLVHQFSDALCFYRELIQNALDAQSRTIQVELTWNEGLTTIAVSDQGEGMTREIIETELTRLFSSSKENDLTKIGKFGVGFVSVFAIHPQAVVVDTSRDGENWRVLFHADRSYTLVKMDQPFGGTIVRLLKPMTGSEYRDLEARSRDILAYWCKFSEAAITFQGEKVNQPFDLESPVKIQYESRGTEVVAALTHDVTPFYGFYNRGLTLVEGRQQFFPHVMFRLKSYWLEHTISRDNVMQDENFRKALAVVKEAVYKELYPFLLERLHHGETALMGFLPGLLRDPASRPPGLWEAPLFPALGGIRLSARDLVKARKKHGAIYGSALATPVTEALRTPVLQLDHDEAFEDCVRAAVGESPLHAETSLFLCLRPQLSTEERRLEAKLDVLVRSIGHPIRRVFLADFGYPGSCITEEIGVLCEQIKHPNRMPPLAHPLPEDIGKAFLLVNLFHPRVVDALRASRQDIALAVHALYHVLVLAGALPTAAAATTLRRAVSLR